MKRFLTFYGSNYYPKGGIKDFVGDYDIKEEAIEAIATAHKKEWDEENVNYILVWGQVWDSETDIIIYKI